MSTFEDLALEHVGSQNQIITQSLLAAGIGSWSKIPGKLIREGHKPSIFRYLAGGAVGKLWPESLVSPPRSQIITGIRLNGSQPHKSHDDPADPKPIIFFALYKSNKLNSQNRVASGHVHDDGTGHVNFPSKYKQYRAITGMEYKPPSTKKEQPTIVAVVKRARAAARLASPAALGNRSQVAPTSHGGQMSRPNMQNGGTARNGLREIGLMSIKNGMLITMANGTIGDTLHRI
ncbi:hypothetical protein B0O99DRAFT_700600 [Bisporella sp. PMI_857]|nr:hypothetical protein B0O99DRAFT_700600 [Bisporella sp. PMI_857]